MPLENFRESSMFTLFSSFFMAGLGLGAGSGGPKLEGHDMSLQKRFARFAEKLPKKTVPEKKLYAACLFHARQARESLNYVEKELKPDATDIPLLVGHYRLAEKNKAANTPDIRGKLVGKVVIKPFEAIGYLEVGEGFRDVERIHAWEAFDAARYHNPLEPRTYFELARLGYKKDDPLDLCAAALFLLEPGSALSASVIEFLEKR